MTRRMLEERLGWTAARWLREVGELDPEERATWARALVEALGDPKASLEIRLAAGSALGIVGDPRLDPLHPPMRVVPEGSFVRGLAPERLSEVAREFDLPEEWLTAAVPATEVWVDEFEIGQFPVTQGEWARFVSETGHPERPPCWSGRRPPLGRESHPVYGISWDGALAYCAWLSQRTGLRYRVPTEEEWEKAARGTDRRAYPWGERFDARLCNTREAGLGTTTPVGMFAEGASPYGVLDMPGNVEEYTASLLLPYAGEPAPEGGDVAPARVTRGGCFALDGDLARCDRRHASIHGGAIGFRLARSRAGRAWARERKAGEAA